MATMDATDALLNLFAGAAAVFDARGELRSCNDAFERAIGSVEGARLEVRGSRGILRAPDAAPRALFVAPLEEDGWLAFTVGAEDQAALAAVASAVARRIERVKVSLETNAQIGLLEGPTGPVAHCLRESLAAAQELRVLRRQVAALGADETTKNQPVCLAQQLREAAAALGRIPIVIEAADANHTVEVDAARLFPTLVALLEDLGEGATKALPLRVTLQSGDFVRVRIVGVPPPNLDTPAIGALRRLVAAYGGRVLLDPGSGLLLELRAYASDLRAGGSFGTILIVDDDASTLAMMGAVLRRAGFRVLPAEDGVAASALLRRHLSEIVAIVADAVLPGRSGLELAAEARRSAPHLPILLVSGHSSDLLGAEDVANLPILAKPFGAHALAERVCALVAHEASRA